MRHIGLAQHETDIRMRDQARGVVNHISLAVLADLNLRNDIPNEREIDLRYYNAEFGPSAGHGYRHVRLRLVDKIDRPVIDLVGGRLNEWSLFRMIDATLDYVGRFP